MIRKEELITMISQFLNYSCENYASDIYDRYRDIVDRSALEESEKAACVSLFTALIKDSIKHLEELRKLKDTIKRGGKNLY